MAQTRDTIIEALSAVALPDGGDLVTRNMIRALRIDAGRVSFVIEADTPEQAATIDPLPGWRG
jgi:ATP-binding protein involved in chromosome partitioning